MSTLMIGHNGGESIWFHRLFSLWTCCDEITMLHLWLRNTSLICFWHMFWFMFFKKKLGIDQKDEIWVILTKKKKEIWVIKHEIRIYQGISSFITVFKKKTICFEPFDFCSEFWCDAPFKFFKGKKKRAVTIL